MKRFKPLKRLPTYVMSGVESVYEEIWQACRTEDNDDGGLSKQEFDALKEYVLKLTNKAMKRSLIK